MKATTIWGLTVAIGLGAPLAGRAQHMSHDFTAHHEESGRAAPSGGSHAAAAVVESDRRDVTIAVTSHGFVPAEVRVKKGEKVRLAITRESDGTCTTEIVVKEYGIRKPLPLAKTVYVELTPEKKGTVSYACGLGLASGVLIVE